MLESRNCVGCWNLPQNRGDPILSDTIRTIIDSLLLRQPEPTVTVLIVDDDNDVREVWRQMLVPLGINAVCASTTREALNLITQGVADILICDWRMEHNGSSVIDQWVAQGNNQPCILISAYLGTIDINTMYVRGVWNVLSKPADIPALRALMILYYRTVKTDKALAQLTKTASNLKRTVLLLALVVSGIAGDTIWNIISPYMQ